MSELLVAYDLVAKGFDVSFPFAATRYDVIAERGGRSYRVQTKTGRIDARTNVLHASWDAPYTTSDADVIAVVDLDATVVYYVKVADLVDSTTNVTLRFEPTTRETTSFDAQACMAWPYENETKEVG